MEEEGDLNYERGGLGSDIFSLFLILVGIFSFFVFFFRVFG